MFCPDSSQFYEGEWSNDWNDYINMEKSKDAAEILGEEFMSLRSFFLS